MCEVTVCIVTNCMLNKIFPLMGLRFLSFSVMLLLYSHMHFLKRFLV